jgi:hypothetical protein
LAGTLETTNPFHRGSLVRRALLCDPLPRPDPNSLPPGSLDPPPPSAAETTRQRFARKTESALCNACHAQFNDIGFVLEAFDANIIIQNVRVAGVQTAGSCTVTFDVSFNIENNNGNKFIFIHAWTQASYPLFPLCKRGLPH